MTTTQWNGGGFVPSPSTVKFVTHMSNNTTWSGENLPGLKWYQQVGEDYREVPAPSAPLPWVQPNPFIPYGVSSDDCEEVPGGGADNPYPFAPLVYPIIPEEPKPLRRRRPGVPEDGEADTPLDQRVRRVLEDL